MVETVWYEKKEEREKRLKKLYKELKNNKLERMLNDVRWVLQHYGYDLDGFLYDEKTIGVEYLLIGVVRDDKKD